MYLGKAKVTSFVYVVSLIVTSLVTQPVSASGVSAYLPLNLSLRAEAEIDRVVALTQGNPMAKPYRVADIQSRLAQIKTDYPVLHTRVSRYLKRFNEKTGVTHAGVEAAHTDSPSGNLPNAHGKSAESEIEGALNAYYRPSEYLLGAVGVLYNDEDNLRHTGTYLAAGYEYAQLDIGYREHWFSPFKHSAMLVSTHAKASPSVTLSNVTPITNWNIRYEIFYSQLEEVERIRLGDEFFPGRPRHAGVHISFSPLDNWSIGLNRTLQFGGGARDVDAGDFFQALFNPAGKDNIEDKSQDPNYEFGNQQASITTRLHLDLGMPLEIYGEYGGEDTLDESNYKLGNQTVGLGIYAPYVTDKLALRYEFNDWSEQWYVHHIYVDGYVNDGVIMGHWGAALREPDRSPDASVHSVSANLEISTEQYLDTRLSVIQNDSERTDYETGYQIEATYSQVVEDGILGISVFFQKDTFGENMSRVALSYQW